MPIPPGHVAKPLYDTVGAEAFSAVAHWLQDVAADFALETNDGDVHPPNVSWLAEAVAFYDPTASP